MEQVNGELMLPSLMSYPMYELDRPFQNQLRVPSSKNQIQLPFSLLYRETP
jgi:hypothetical protein